jgi:hypothetical protein
MFDVGDLVLLLLLDAVELGASLKRVSQLLEGAQHIGCGGIVQNMRCVRCGWIDPPTRREAKRIEPV